MNTDDHDRDLLSRIARKDSAALQALYGGHNVRVFRFIMRMVANKGIAEELTNEVFLRIWRKAGTFKGKSAASTWIFSIARNETISFLRKRTELALDEGVAEQLEDDADTPEVIVAKQDKATRMQACIAELSPAHKEVVDLVYYQEKTISEVSEILNIPANTVKTRMFHARQQLSHHFKAAGIDRGWP